MKIFLFLITLLVPLVITAAGWFMHKHPPRDINWVIGYRTMRSMKSKEAWMFAQKKMGILWEKVGAIALIVSIAVQIPFLFFSVETMSIVSLVLMFVQLAVLIASVLPVERALKKQFPDPQK